MIISVVGEGRPPPEIAAMAEAVGAELGRRCITLVCGGGAGVMEAACRGAKSTGGTTVGILPSGDSRYANQWVDIPIPTGMGQARNAIVVQSGCAVIAVGGRYGTLSEIGHALKAGIAVIGLNTWQVAKGDTIDLAIIVADDALDAVEKAIDAANRPRTMNATND